MGLDRTIHVPAGNLPAWDAIASSIARSGEPAVIRMIDGLPAFPDESPEVGWRELRLSVGAGMITIRRGTDSLQFVVWGNADPALLATLDRVVGACAEACGVPTSK